MNNFWLILLLIYLSSTLLDFILFSSGDTLKKHPATCCVIMLMPIVNTWFFASTIYGLILDYKKENGSES